MTFPSRFAIPARLLLLAALLLTLLLAPAVQAEERPLRWGYYVPWDTSSLDALRQRLGELDVVALHWANLDGEGTLEVQEQPAVTSLLRGFTGKALVEVTNRDFDQETAHVLLTDPLVRERAMAALLSLAGRWNGLVLDFENLAPADRAAYTRFVAELRSRLGPDKLLAVAIAARTRDAGTGWAAGYDYAGLARSADLVFLMAYAFRTATSAQPGPTAPLTWIEAALKHALTEIPREKLVVGLPAYGYDWALGEARPDPPGRSVTFRSATDLARQHGQAVEYDAQASGAFFRYHDGEHEREVWFEDRRAFAQKLELVERYRVRGVGWWRLGGEDPTAWQALGIRMPATTASIGPAISPATSAATAATPTSTTAATAGTPKGRFFPESGYAVASAPFQDYFQRRGSVPTFGYPISNQFYLLGTQVQLFQRGAMQLGPDGGVRLLNLLELMPLRQVNFSTLPAPDPLLQREAPPVGAPDYGSRVLGWLRETVADTWEGEPVGFHGRFFGSVDCRSAFPNEDCRSELLPLMSLELWGLPISRPARDPNNRNFIYQRFQRGVLHYDATSRATQGLLIGEYFKAALTGANLPADLAQDLRTSSLLRQYDPKASQAVARARELPGSDLRGAF